MAGAPGASLGDLLQPYRDDAPEAAVVCVDDLEMMRIAVAWQHVPKGWREPRTKRPEGEAELWDWLWAGVQVNPRDLASAANVGPEHRAIDKLNTLARVRAVLPDGTVKKSVLSFIRATIARGAGL